jgi:hypothetical protein
MPYWAFSLDGFYIPLGGYRYTYKGQKNPMGIDTDYNSFTPSEIKDLGEWLRQGTLGYIGLGYSFSDDFTIAFDYASGSKENQFDHLSQGKSISSSTYHSRRPSDASSSESDLLVENPWETPKEKRVPRKQVSTPLSVEPTITTYRLFQTYKGPNLHFKFTLLPLHSRLQIYGVGTLGLLIQELIIREEQEQKEQAQWDLTFAAGIGIQYKFFSWMSLDISYTSIIGHYTVYHSPNKLKNSATHDLLSFGLRIHV